MNAKLFAETMSEVNDKYYEESVNYTSKRKSRSWLKDGYMAACLAIMVAAATIYVLSTFPGPDSIKSPNNRNSIVMNEISELPQIFLPNLSEDTLVRKSSEEMFEYYGINFADRLSTVGTFTEQKELHPHGFYFDGTFDLNWFAYASEGGAQEILICVGKSTHVGKYMSSWLQSSASKSQIGGTEMYLYHSKGTSETCYYAVFELNGCEMYVESFTDDEQGFIAILEALVSA